MLTQMYLHTYAHAHTVFYVWLCVGNSLRRSKSWSAEVYDAPNSLPNLAYPQVEETKKHENGANDKIGVAQRSGPPRSTPALPRGQGLQAGVHVCAHVYVYVHAWMYISA